MWRSSRILSLLGGGERVEFDPVVGVGEIEALEGGEDVRAGGLGEPAFGQQRQQRVLVAGVVRERLAQAGFDQSEDQQGDPDGADSGDAVVVVQKDGSEFSGSV